MSKSSKNKINRRTFLALAGGTGAGFVFQSQEKYIHKLIPYVNAPQYPNPGEWSYYLSTCRECPAGCGLMMWYRDGRVTKAEGNPEHPVNGGKLCIRGQSSVLGEYDTDRIKHPLVKKGEEEYLQTDWKQALSEIRNELSAATDVKLVSGLQTGSLAGVMEEFAARFNQKPLYYEVFNYESMRKANAEIYGKPIIPRYNLQESDLIVSFGADFLETWLSPVEYAREFGKFHSVENNKIGRFVYLGPVNTMTAMNADEFIVTEPGKEAQLISALMNRLGRINSDVSFSEGQIPDELGQKLDELADDIKRARKPVILAGGAADKSSEGQRTVRAANLLNQLLGNQAVDTDTFHALSKTALSQETLEFFQSVTENTILFIHDTNPVFTNPELTKYIEKAKHVVFIGNMPNETAAFADKILPSNYYMESWGDYEAWSGTVSLMQPVMQPLFDTKSAGDIFLLLNQSGKQKDFSEVVRNNWRKWSSGKTTGEIAEEDKNAGLPIENFSLLLQKGYLKKEKEEFISTMDAAVISKPSNGKNRENSFFLQVLPSHYFYDGRLANRGWLQEIPHPVSNVVWQSWINMNTEKARELDISDGDVITVTSPDNSKINVSVRVTDDVDKNTLAIDAGQGHQQLGEIANGVGVNPFFLLSLSGSNLPEVTIEKTGDNEKLLYLNATKDQHDRELLQHIKLEDLRQGTFETEEMNWPMPGGYTKEGDLYKGHEHKDHRWGMVIDLQSCIGCKACEAACYAENNIPVVGKENCWEGREMSWLKVVPYKISEKKSAYLPVPCQHCDAAPCEPVCPVYASVHTEEGLNAQIYNRCIGTRYCSNNCPYKVRRFNWVNIKYDYPRNLQLNPEVTVRERGVMEKCTFCVQRIRNREYNAKTENRPLLDGEIVPACAQTCPTEAIVFGDLMDENSRVRKLIENERKYQLLNELNTKTAVVYLKKITI